MGFETIYYTISIALFIASASWLWAIYLARVKHRTMQGQKIKPGTKEFANIQKFASNKNIAITVIVLLIFTTNLAYNVIRLVNHNHPDAKLLAVIWPIISLIIYTLLYSNGRRKGGYRL